VRYANRTSRAGPTKKHSPMSDARLLTNINFAIGEAAAGLTADDSG
jgi:hypothetical protein